MVTLTLNLFPPMGKREGAITMNHIETMEKLYRLSVDRAAAKGEITNSRKQMRRLANKHKVDLQSFIFDMEFQGRAEVKNADAAERRAKAQPVAKATKKRSRRSLIIEHLKEGAWDIKALAVHLTTMGYPDVKANKKAVSGTMYDFHTNKGWFFRRDAETDLITVEIPA